MGSYFFSPMRFQNDERRLVALGAVIHMEFE
jgi:hypothetical protein